MSTSKDPLKKLTHVRMSKGGNHQSHIKDEKSSPDQGSSGALKDKSEDLNTDIEENIDKQPKSKKSGNLPGFLSRIGGEDETRKEGELTQRALAVIEEKVKDNPNSFGSIFSREHQEISGIQRVFKKSIAFLVINLMLFGVLSLISINLLALPIWFTVVISVFYVTSSCLFFIIVADRSYLWLSIAGQLILLLLVHSFLGQGFDIITIILALLISALIFSAYSELEKIQLGSRLFFISHITGESVRILTTVIAIVLSLGLFNSVVSAGTEQYIEDNILSSDLVMNRLLIGDNPSVSMNRVLLKGNTFFGEGNEEYTFRDFLSFNYRGGKSVLTQEESNEIIIACQVRPNSTSSDCNEEVNEEEDERLEEWRQEAYPNLQYDLDEVIGEAEFRTITKEYYLYLIRDLSRYDSAIRVIPSDYVIPAFISVILFAFLLIVKPLVGWISYLVTWIVWRILKWIGFVRIEVEAVEAEIVSI